MKKTTHKHWFRMCVMSFARHLLSLAYDPLYLKCQPFLDKLRVNNTKQYCTNSQKINNVLVTSKTFFKFL